jgi:hypothetical protein
MTPNVGDTIIVSLNEGFRAAARFIPNLIAGIIILLIGIILASIVKRLIVELLRAVRVEEFLERYGVPRRKEFSWSNLIAEIIRWFVIVLFLVPAADVLGLGQVSVLLNQFLLYLPNVFVSAIIALVGFVFARLAYDLVLASSRDLLQDGASLVASVVRWAIIVFVVLAVLNQLGVAEDLVRILFTGLVAMVALAGGLAFGLGGQDTARSLLESLRTGLGNARAQKK